MAKKDKAPEIVDGAKGSVDAADPVATSTAPAAADEPVKEAAVEIEPVKKKAVVENEPVKPKLTFVTSQRPVGLHELNKSSVNIETDRKRAAKKAAEDAKLAVEKAILAATRG